MEGEDSGLLGGLPRERRGTRSDKRSRTRNDQPPQGSAPRPRTRPAETGSSAESPDPGGPIRGAGRIAGAGLRVAGGVTRGVLRRLPRP